MSMRGQGVLSIFALLHSTCYNAVFPSLGALGCIGLIYEVKNTP